MSSRNFPQSQNLQIFNKANIDLSNVTDDTLRDRILELIDFAEQYWVDLNESESEFTQTHDGLTTEIGSIPATHFSRKIQYNIEGRIDFQRIRTDDAIRERLSIGDVIHVNVVVGGTLSHSRYQLVIDNDFASDDFELDGLILSLIHISEPTRPY